MSRVDAVARAIDASGWEALLADLGRTPSHRGVERQEEAAVSVLTAGLVLLLIAHAMRWGPV